MSLSMGSFLESQMLAGLVLDLVLSDVLEKNKVQWMLLNAQPNTILAKGTLLKDVAQLGGGGVPTFVTLGKK